MEAVYHGVPVLGMPLSSDQFASLARSKREGYALTMKSGDMKDQRYRSILSPDFVIKKYHAILFTMYNNIYIYSSTCQKIHIARLYIVVLSKNH